MYCRETHKKTVTLMSIPSQSSDSLQWAFSCGSCCLCLHLWRRTVFVLSFLFVDKRGFVHRWRMRKHWNTCTCVVISLYMFIFFYKNMQDVCLPALQSGQQSTSVNHQRTKGAVCPIDSEKGLFIPPECTLVTSANELRLDLFQLFAIDPT